MINNLGIVYNEKGKIINHRSLLKVVCNPFLRLIGLQVGTVFDREKQELYHPKIMRTKRVRKLLFDYDLAEGWVIKKERTLI